MSKNTHIRPRGPSCARLSCVNLLAAEEVALLSGRAGQAPGADIVVKGCPSEGCPWLLRMGPAAVGGQQKSRHTPQRALAHDENFLRGHSFPGDWQRVVLQLREIHHIWQKCIHGSQSLHREHRGRRPADHITVKGYLPTLLLRKISQKIWGFSPVLAFENHKCFYLGYFRNMECLQIFINFKPSVKI